MLGPQHINEIQKCNGYNMGEAKKHFDHLATNYEAIYLRLGFPDPLKVAEKAEKYATQRGLKKDTCKVLDLGCGSGLVGHGRRRQDDGARSGTQEVNGPHRQPQHSPRMEFELREVLGSGQGHHSRVVGAR